MPFPDWFASIMMFPALVTAMVLPSITPVPLLALSRLNVTGKPELAVAIRGIVKLAAYVSGVTGCEKVIV